MRLLAEAATVISSESCTEITMSLKCSLDIFFHQALYADILSPKLLKFLWKDVSSNHAGTFRLRVKLHKNPAVGRPIMNLSRAWFAPAAIYLTETLRPALKQLPYVIKETSWSCLQANISSLNTCCALLIFATCIRALTVYISFRWHRFMLENAGRIHHNTMLF